ncbi:hypothetical protein ACHAWF_003192 [Thalassiosira exigua]
MQIPRKKSVNSTLGYGCIISSWKYLLLVTLFILGSISTRLNDQITSNDNYISPKPRYTPLNDDNTISARELGAHVKHYSRKMNPGRQKEIRQPPYWQKYRLKCGTVEALANDTVVETTRLLPSIPPFRMSIHDVSQDNYVSGHIKKDGCHECALVKLVQKTLVQYPDSFLLDIGANIGMYALAAAAAKREAFAIEPLWQNHRKICLSVQQNKGFDEWVHVLPAAATERRGKEFVLDVPGHNKGGTRIEELGEEKLGGGNVVKGIAVDDLGLPSLSSGIGRPLVLKLDVEGHEIEALAGTKNLICGKHSRVVLALLEIRPRLFPQKKEALDILSCLSKKHRLVPIATTTKNKQVIDPTAKPDPEKQLDLSNFSEWIEMAEDYFIDVIWYPAKDVKGVMEKYHAWDNAKQPIEKEKGGIVLSQEFLRSLRDLGPFPKKLHTLFPNKDYFKREPPLNFVKHGVLRFMELNPSWNVSVYDDADMDGLIKRAASDRIISVAEKNLLLGNATNPSAHAVERADLARLLIVWYHGGVSWPIRKL